MRLIVLPANPGSGDGYEIGVRSDLARLCPGQGDVVVCFSHRPPADNTFMHLNRKRNQSLRRAANVLAHRIPSEVWAFELAQFIRGNSFDEVFCGDTIFYRALRRLLPGVHMKVRISNFFSFARYRQSLRRFPIPWRLAYLFDANSRCEAEVLSDKNVTPIFITTDELAFAKLALPHLRGECWQVIEPIALSSLTIKPPSIPRLVYFGNAISAHAVVGVRMLCTSVFPRIASAVEGVELHLFGYGTDGFSNVRQRIYGHGRYEGRGLPFNGDGLFTVPDLHGCGIKLKVADLLRANVPFISTVFGMSGYEVPQNPHVLVADIEEWPKIVSQYLHTIPASGEVPPKN